MKLALSEVQELLSKTLIDDFDASPHLAQEAASRLTQDDIDEYDDIDDLAEMVHDDDEGRFWD